MGDDDNGTNNGENGGAAGGGAGGGVGGAAATTHEHDMEERLIRAIQVRSSISNFVDLAILGDIWRWSKQPRQK